MLKYETIAALDQRIDQLFAEGTVNAMGALDLLASFGRAIKWPQLEAFIEQGLSAKESSSHVVALKKCKVWIRRVVLENTTEREYEKRNEGRFTAATERATEVLRNAAGIVNVPVGLLAQVAVLTRDEYDVRSVLMAYILLPQNDSMSKPIALADASETDVHELVHRQASDYLSAVAVLREVMQTAVVSDTELIRIASM